MQKDKNRSKVIVNRPLQARHKDVVNQRGLITSMFGNTNTHGKCTPPKFYIYKMKTTEPCPVYLLKVLSLFTLLCKLWKSHVQKLQENNRWNTRRSFIHGVKQISKGLKTKQTLL